MLDAFVLTIENNLPPALFDELIKQASGEKRERIERCRFLRDKQNLLLADVLIRRELSKRTGIPADELSFSRGAYGKPIFLTDPAIHFNVSHTGGYIAAAIGGSPVGIDIEAIRTADLRIAEKRFAPDEREYIFSQSPEQMKHRAFFEIWTKKESRLKLEGSGLTRPLGSFSVLSEKEGAPVYHTVLDSAAAVCHLCTAGAETARVTIAEALSVFG